MCTTIHHPGMFLGWRCYLGIPGYLDRGIAMHYHYHTPSRDVPGMAVLLGNPGILRQGYSYVHYHTPSRDVPEMAVLLGNPGILRQGYSNVHYHYHTPSRDVPGMAVLLGVGDYAYRGVTLN